MKTLFWKILALVLFLQPYPILNALWSPPVDIPFSDVGKVSFSQFDSAENMIELYSSVPDTQAIRAVRILPNGAEAPSVLISPGSSDGVRPLLERSPSGENLIAVWLNTVSNEIQTAIYTAATESWSGYKTVGTVTSLVNEPVVSIDSSNRATIGWIDQDTFGDVTVYSSTLFPLSSGWTTPASYSTSTDVNATKFRISASGHFVAASWGHELSGDNYFHFIQIDQSVTTPAWNVVDNINIGSSFFNNPLLREDSLGNMVQVWPDGDIYAWNSSALGGYVNLFSPVGPMNFFLQVDHAGRASFLCSQSSQTDAKVLFFSSGNWSPVATLNTPNLLVSDVKVNPVSIDAIGLGHTHFVWVQSDNPTLSVINFATLTNPPNDSVAGVWSSPLILSDALERSVYPGIVENASGDLLVAWLHLADITDVRCVVTKRMANSSTWSTPVVPVLSGDEGYVIALSSLGRGGILGVSEVVNALSLSVEISEGPIPPAPPTNLVGETIKNTFLTQKDRIHLLSWQPSPDAAVAYYQVYRNGVLIAAIPSTGPFEYADHNRNKRVADTYVIVAVGLDGGVSSPVSIILQ